MEIEVFFIHLHFQRETDPNLLTFIFPFLSQVEAIFHAINIEVVLNGGARISSFQGKTREYL